MISTWRKAAASASSNSCAEVATMTADEAVPHVGMGDPEFPKHVLMVRALAERGITEGDTVVVMRDSKLGDASPKLVFTPGEWGTFLDGARAGEFNLDADGKLPQHPE